MSHIEQLNLPAMSLTSLLQFGSGMLLKEAIAAEIRTHLGRDKYGRSGEVRGYRNGYQKTTIDTPVGPIEYDRPKVTGCPEFKSQFHTPRMTRPEEFTEQIADMYVNGISTRKIKKALEAVAGKKVRASRSTVSRITKRLRDEFAHLW